MVNDKHIVLFDGVCNLCSRLVRFISLKDRKSKFTYVSLQSAKGKKLLLAAGLPPDDTGTVVYITRDKYYLRSSAVLHILKELRGAWRFFYMFIIVPAPIRDFVYNIVAGVRYMVYAGKSTDDLGKRSVI